MHSKSDNREIMINERVDEVVEELFKSLLNRYQIGLEKEMKGLTLIMFIYCVINVIK